MYNFKLNKMDSNKKLFKNMRRSKPNDPVFEMIDQIQKNYKVDFDSVERQEEVEKDSQKIVKEAIEKHQKN